MATGIGDLLLSFHYESKAKRGAVNETLKIPFVTDIERSVNVNLTEMPTLIYGCRNNFCMDLGATEKVTFKCERINPIPYNDASSDPEKWSNGKWYRHLEDLFDRWQNFGYNSSGDRTGGCQMSFTPADTVLLPAMGANVFLTGAISPSYDVQKMSFSLPLTLADMTMAGGDAETVTITLDPGTSSIESETVTLLKGFPQVIPIPDGWESKRPGFFLIGWKIGSDRISKSSSYVFSGDATATAIWNEPTRCYLFDSTGVTVVESDETYMTVTLVGGGGGGGGSGYVRASSLNAIDWFVGGGGGAGEVVTLEADVSSGSNIRIECGEGGSGGTTRTSDTTSVNKPTNGGAGGNTLLQIDGVTRATAHGGSGGSAATLNLYVQNASHGAGGSSYQAGGTHSGSKGGDGSTASPNISDNTGKGFADVEIPVGGSYTSPTPPVTIAGGCGGAAAAFRVENAPLTGAGRVVTYATVESVGGDGGDPSTGTLSQDGKLGGGGGSGRYVDKECTGVGGRGCALVYFYKGGL